MSEQRSPIGDQSVVRLIRQAVNRFDSLPDDDIEGKLRCVLLLAGLGATSLISNNQMRQSTVSFLVGRI